MTVQLVRKVRAGAPPPSSDYHAPVDTTHAPFTFASGPGRAPIRRGRFHFGWVVGGALLAAAGAGSFIHFFTR